MAVLIEGNQNKKVLNTLEQILNPFVFTSNLHTKGLARKFCIFWSDWLRPSDNVGLDQIN